MRPISVMFSVSLDGFIEGPNRELDWHVVDDELHSHFNERLAKLSAFLMGRTTFQLMDEFWPTADQDPAAPPTMVEFAGIWRRMPKIVYSTTLQQVDDRTATLVHEVDPDEVRRLKAEPGGGMNVGGADLAAEFRRHGLIDEYWLYVVPVVIGSGKPLFESSETRMQLALAETRQFGNGVVLLRYRVEH